MPTFIYKKYEEMVVGESNTTDAKWSFATYG